MKRFDEEDAAMVRALDLLWKDGDYPTLVRDITACWAALRGTVDETQRQNRKLLKLLEAKLQGPPGPPGPTGPRGIGA